MPIMMLGQVLQLPDTSFKTFPAGVLHPVLVGDIFVCENGLDVGTKDDGAAGEVAEAQDRLDLGGAGGAVAGDFDGGGEGFVPLG